MATRTAMRNKHTCQICGQPFSRYWNMERHMVRKHYPRQRVFSNCVMNHQIRHKVQKSGYYNSYLDLHNSSTGFNWPLQGALTFEQENPSWLGWLRKLAEISSLLKEIMPTLASQSSINPFIESYLYSLAMITILTTHSS